MYKNISTYILCMSFNCFFMCCRSTNHANITFSKFFSFFVSFDIFSNSLWPKPKQWFRSLTKSLACNKAFLDNGLKMTIRQGSYLVCTRHDKSFQTYQFPNTFWHPFISEHCISIEIQPLHLLHGNQFMKIDERNNIDASLT